MTDVIKYQELTPREKINLVILNSSPEVPALWKMMENVLALNVTEVLEIDDRIKRAEAMDVLFAMRKFYKDIRDMISLESDEHFAQTKAAAAQKELEDQENLEKIIFDQETGLTI